MGDAAAGRGWRAAVQHAACLEKMGNFAACATLHETAMKEGAEAVASAKEAFQSRDSEFRKIKKEMERHVAELTPIVDKLGNFNITKSGLAELKTMRKPPVDVTTVVSTVVAHLFLDSQSEKQMSWAEVRGWLTRTPDVVGTIQARLSDLSDIANVAALPKGAVEGLEAGLSSTTYERVNKVSPTAAVFFQCGMAVVKIYEPAQKMMTELNPALQEAQGTVDRSLKILNDKTSQLEVHAARKDRAQAAAEQQSAFTTMEALEDLLAFFDFPRGFSPELTQQLEPLLGSDTVLAPADISTKVETAVIAATAGLGSAEGATVGDVARRLQKYDIRLASARATPPAPVVDYAALLTSPLLRELDNAATRWLAERQAYTDKLEKSNAGELGTHDVYHLLRMQESAPVVLLVGDGGAVDRRSAFVRSFAKDSEGSTEEKVPVRLPGGHACEFVLSKRSSAEVLTMPEDEACCVAAIALFDEVGSPTQVEAVQRILKLANCSVALVVDANDASVDENELLDKAGSLFRLMPWRLHVQYWRPPNRPSPGQSLAAAASLMSAPSQANVLQNIVNAAVYSEHRCPAVSVLPAAPPKGAARAEAVTVYFSGGRRRHFATGSEVAEEVRAWFGLKDQDGRAFTTRDGTAPTPAMRKRPRKKPLQVLVDGRCNPAHLVNLAHPPPLEYEEACPFLPGQCVEYAPLGTDGAVLAMADEIESVSSFAVQLVGGASLPPGSDCLAPIGTCAAEGLIGPGGTDGDSGPEQFVWELYLTLNTKAAAPRACFSRDRSTRTLRGLVVGTDEHSVSAACPPDAIAMVLPSTLLSKKVHFAAAAAAAVFTKLAAAGEGGDGTRPVVYVLADPEAIRKISEPVALALDKCKELFVGDSVGALEIYNGGRAAAAVEIKPVQLASGAGQFDITERWDCPMCTFHMTSPTTVDQCQICGSKRDLGDRQEGG
eukprot:TRINITY_DN19316_c0_g1_i1.p1 TRINITY_DN19316_c0_g1~~TRINITY_DN19316_c0_g1_i1.p1  ORF type:complete len:946 (+),score=151.84 TRINITY_DN19316_c0_g1_i1:57-2894(+)